MSEWNIWCEDREDPEDGETSTTEDLFNTAEKYANKKFEKDFELDSLRLIAENIITKQRNYYYFYKEITWYVAGSQINTC